MLPLARLAARKWGYESYCLAFFISIWMWLVSFVTIRIAWISVARILWWLIVVGVVFLHLKYPNQHPLMTTSHQYLFSSLTLHVTWKTVLMMDPILDSKRRYTIMNTVVFPIPPEIIMILCYIQFNDSVTKLTIMKLYVISLEVLYKWLSPRNGIIMINILEK